MKLSNSEISFYVDTMIVETLLAEPKLSYKQAGIVNDLLNRIKDYFMQHIDKSHPVESVLTILAPGALWLTFQALGIGKWGLLLGLLANVLHINVGGMLASFYEKVKSLISGGKQVSSSDIDQIASSVTSEHNTPPTEDEAKDAYQQMQKQQDIPVTYSSMELLEEAKFIRLALISYEDQQLRLTKKAGLLSFISGFGLRKSKGTSLLANILGWIFKLALGSAGLMVAGDVINKVIDRPNALDKTYQAGQPDKQIPEKSVPLPVISTQTKFKVKGDAPLPRMVTLTNSPQNVEAAVMQFAKDTYFGLDGKESIIQGTPGFMAVVSDINHFNELHLGSAGFFIPPTYTSKKQMTDYFIDDVAKMSI